jgi:hypothetical protein
MTRPCRITPRASQDIEAIFRYSYGGQCPPYRLKDSNDNVHL